MERNNEIITRKRRRESDIEDKMSFTVVTSTA